MPRLFDGVDDTIRLLGPATSPLIGFDAGPCTIALVFRPVEIADSLDTLFSLSDSESASHTLRTYMQPTNAYNISNGTQGNGFAHIINIVDGWFLMVVTRPQGTGPSRFHRYRYGPADWFHGDGLALPDSVFPVTNAPAVVFGSDSDSFANFHVAAAGVWTRVLSDAECETMPLQITSWLNMPGGGPVACWTFSQTSVTDPVLDLTGSGLNQSSITGTTVSASISPINEGTYQYVRPTAITRSPTVGSPSVSTIIQNVLPAAVAGAPTVGSPAVELGPAPQELSPDAVAGSATVGSPSLSLGTPPTYRLLVPTVQQPYADVGLWRFYSIDTGQTLVKDDGTWQLVRSPRDDLIGEFEGAYRGGYVHTVDALTAIELIRDGFGDALEEIPA